MLNYQMAYNLQMFYVQGELGFERCRPSNRSTYLSYETVQRLKVTSHNVSNYYIISDASWTVYQSLKGWSYKLITTWHLFEVILQATRNNIRVEKVTRYLTAFILHIWTVMTPMMIWTFSNFLLWKTSVIIWFCTNVLQLTLSKLGGYTVDLL